ncbi:CHAD domain-containing protein [Candidatus Poribacteria bacterium]|nr:CHAD domain-containing protein [Candidatus Poribacteria bacterium]MYA58814.1 CHAD domain-containing protein [Candidatus Poribacteria bacterium]
MAKAHKITGVAPLRSYRENARIILPQRLEEVYTWEPFIRDETKREELHNMRISIKRLRYTMELFRVASGLPADDQYAGFLAVIVDLQEILGDIHDADVVLEVLADYTSQSGNREGQVDIPSGVATLIARTQETRKADYETFLEKWDQLSAAGFKQELLSFFLS